MMIQLIVPLYYLCVQSAFHTEYRCILPMQYFLFAVAAVALVVIFSGGATAITWMWRKAAWRRPAQGQM